MVQILHWCITLQCKRHDCSPQRTGKVISCHETLHIKIQISLDSSTVKATCCNMCTIFCSVNINKSYLTQDGSDICVGNIPVSQNPPLRKTRFPLFTSEEKMWCNASRLYMGEINMMGTSSDIALYQKELKNTLYNHIKGKNSASLPQQAR